MMETLKLCVSCKACRHECPTGVDMARMKIEVLAARVASRGLSLRDRLVGYLPRYAPLAARLAWFANLRNSSALLRALFEKVAGISAKRALPAFRSDTFHSDSEVVGPADGHEVVLFADTFNRAYERENLDAALRVLVAGGYRVHLPKPAERESAAVLRPHLPVRRPRRRGARRARPAGRDLRAVCSARCADRWAGAELPAYATRRALGAAQGRNRESDQRACAVVRGIPGARGKGRTAQASARRDRRQGAVARPLPPEILWRVQAGRAGAAADPRSRCRDRRVHPAAAWRAPSATAPTPTAPRSRWPSCRCFPPCGARTTSTIIVADGTSCRHQIKDGTPREAFHAARVLAISLDRAKSSSGNKDKLNG